MLYFYTVSSDEVIECKDGVIEETHGRPWDYSIDIQPFHRIMENGLGQVASEVGLSFFSDALLEVISCKKILNVLLKIDAELNPDGNKTENRDMAEFFTIAIKQKRRVVVSCDLSERVVILGNG